MIKQKYILILCSILSCMLGTSELRSMDAEFNAERLVTSLTDHSPKILAHCDQALLFAEEIILKVDLYEKTKLPKNKGKRRTVKTNRTNTITTLTINYLLSLAHAYCEIDWSSDDLEHNSALKAYICACLSLSDVSSDTFLILAKALIALEEHKDDLKDMRTFFKETDCDLVHTEKTICAYNDTTALKKALTDSFETFYRKEKEFRTTVTAPAHASAGGAAGGLPAAKRSYTPLTEAEPFGPVHLPEEAFAHIERAAQERYPDCWQSFVLQKKMGVYLRLAVQLLEDSKLPQNRSERDHLERNARYAFVMMHGTLADHKKLCSDPTYKAACKESGITLPSTELPIDFMDTIRALTERGADQDQLVENAGKMIARAMQTAQRKKSNPSISADVLAAEEVALDWNATIMGLKPAAQALDKAALAAKGPSQVFVPGRK